MTLPATSITPLSPQELTAPMEADLHLICDSDSRSGGPPDSLTEAMRRFETDPCPTTWQHCWEAVLTYLGYTLLDQIEEADDVLCKELEYALDNIKQMAQEMIADD